MPGVAARADTAPRVDPDVARDLGVGGRARSARWARRAAVGALVVLALAAGAWLVAERVLAPSRTGWITEPARRGDLTVTVGATGTVEPLGRVEVSAQTSGRIAEVHVDDNERVTRGQLLAVIDREPVVVRLGEARARVAAARAQLRQAQATRTESRRTLERVSELVRRGVLPEQQLDTAQATAEGSEAAVESARAQIALAQASLRALQTELEHTEVRSPVDGIVLARQAEPGQVVAATFAPPTLFVIAEDLSRMELVLLVDEADVGRVEAGQRARFTVDAFPGRVFEARVESVRNAPQEVQGVVSYEATLSVDNREGLLRPGMTATADIVVDEQRDVLLVPNAALRFVPPGQTGHGAGREVWVLGEEGRPRAIEVTTGASDGRMSEVRSGEIAAGTELLVDVEHEE